MFGLISTKPVNTALTFAMNPTRFAHTLLDSAVTHQSRPDFNFSSIFWSFFTFHYSFSTTIGLFFVIQRTITILSWFHSDSTFQRLLTFNHRLYDFLTSSDLLFRRNRNRNPDQTALIPFCWESSLIFTQNSQQPTNKKKKKNFLFIK